MEQQKIIEIIKANPKLSYEEFKEQASEVGMTEADLKNAYDTLKHGKGGNFWKIQKFGLIFGLVGFIFGFFWIAIDLDAIKPILFIAELATMIFESPIVLVIVYSFLHGLLFYFLGLLIGILSTKFNIKFIPAFVEKFLTKIWSSPYKKGILLAFIGFLGLFFIAYLALYQYLHSSYYLKKYEAIHCREGTYLSRRCCEWECLTPEQQAGPNCAVVCPRFKLF